MKKSDYDNPPWSVGIYSLVNFDTLERLCDLGESSLKKEQNELHQAMDKDYDELSSPNEEDA